MVNLDRVKTGDTVIIETTVFVDNSSGYIGLDVAAIRNWDGNVPSNIKVLKHKSKAIDEPTGFGAMVRGTEAVTGVTHVFLNTGLPVSPWVLKKNGIRYSWEEVIAYFINVQVINTGLEQEVKD